MSESGAADAVDATELGASSSAAAPAIDPEKEVSPPCLATTSDFALAAAVGRFVAPARGHHDSRPPVSPCVHPA